MDLQLPPTPPMDILSDSSSNSSSAEFKVSGKFLFHNFMLTISFKTHELKKILNSDRIDINFSLQVFKYSEVC
jgi:hypothetical protein